MCIHACTDATYTDDTYTCHQFGRIMWTQNHAIMFISLALWVCLSISLTPLSISLTHLSISLSVGPRRPLPHHKAQHRLGNGGAVDGSRSGCRAGDLEREWLQGR